MSEQFMDSNGRLSTLKVETEYKKSLLTFRASQTMIPIVLEKHKVQELINILEKLKVKMR